MLAFNRLLAYWYRPERGWDPVPAEHAQRYAAHEWQNIDWGLVDQVERWVGGLSGKSVLDLGAGPGHYSVAFAQRGAQVVWYDISHHYLRIATEKAQEHRVQIEFVIGYIDEAAQKLQRQFDLVFNKGCFNYCWEDRMFTDMIYHLVKPGGCGYIRTNNACMGAHNRPLNLRLRYVLYQRFGVKIGHPYPPRGRVVQLLLRHPIQQLLLDYSLPDRDILFFHKPGGKG